jgi:hypothetical protein
MRPAASVKEVSVAIGLDIAKSVFEVHSIDAEGAVVIGRKPRRHYVLLFFGELQPCLVGIEACASSHHWSCELKGLRSYRMAEAAGPCEGRMSNGKERARDLTAREDMRLSTIETCPGRATTRLGTLRLLLRCSACLTLYLRSKVVDRCLHATLLVWDAGDRQRHFDAGERANHGEVVDVAEVADAEHFAGDLGKAGAE